MTRLGDIAGKIRSKNAGPFWVTLDLFFDDAETYRVICKHLSTQHVAQVFQTQTQLIKRFELDDLLVIKLSLPRPVIQGTLADRDMHGASFAALLADLDLGSQGFAEP